MIGSVVMVDFSRAEGSKNHRSSFLKASGNIIEFIQALQEQYRSTWERLEEARKERAAIIEETIQLLKNNKIKLGKQLGRCNNAEINKELLNAINALNYLEKEKIEINLIKINNRYELILDLGTKLESMSQQLTGYRVLEDDYEEEVEIVIPKKTKEKQDHSKVVEFPKEKKEEKLENDKINTDLSEVHEQKRETIDEQVEDISQIEEPSRLESTPVKASEESSEILTDDLEEVINVKQASPELEADLDAKIHQLQPKVIQPEIKEQKGAYEEDLYIDPEKLFNTTEMFAIQSEVDYAMNMDEEIYTQEDYQTEEEENEYILFTINDKNTLKEIAKNVYQDEKYWEYIYYYGNNQSKIDAIAYDLDVPVEAVASFAGYLENVTLQFPTTIEEREEIQGRGYGRRAA